MLLMAVGQESTEEEVADMMALADGDGSGSIDFWEFATLMMHNMADPNPEETLRAAFQVFDSNGDGMISAKELKRVMRWARAGHEPGTS